MSQLGPSWAQASAKPQYLVVQSGFTNGSFAHYTDDFTPKLNLFGGSNYQTGQVVEHRFTGGLLGIDWVHELREPGDTRSQISLHTGLSLLAASDHLAFQDGRRETLTLVMGHPTMGITWKKGSKWLLRGDAGLLLGRVGYYAENQDGFLLTRTVVDTVTVVPTSSFRAGWANWVLLDIGFGANGLLGMANPVWQAGVGTGFGARSPITLLAGTTGAASTDEDKTSPDHFFLQLEAAPVARPWQAKAFFTFGSGTYGRMALQLAYRLPTKAAGAAAE